MEAAIAKAGVLKRRSSKFWKKEERFFVLANNGGLWYARGFAADYLNLKLCLKLDRATEITVEAGGSGESGSVLKVYVNGVGQKTPPAELQALSEAETLAWSIAMREVVELVGAINNDLVLAQPRPLVGARRGEEGWYLDTTGRMALYTYNAEGIWTVSNRREYDEATIRNWTMSRENWCSTGNSIGEQADVAPTKPVYPLNSPSRPDEGQVAPRAEYPVQQSQPTVQVAAPAEPPRSSRPKWGAFLRPNTTGDSRKRPGTMATTSEPWGSSAAVVSSPIRPRSRAVPGGNGLTGVGGVDGVDDRGGYGYGGGGGEFGDGVSPAGARHILPSKFPVGKSDAERDEDNLVLRRPAEMGRLSPQVYGAEFAQGLAAPPRQEPEGRFMRRKNKTQAVNAEEERWGMSPGMEVLQWSVTA